MNLEIKKLFEDSIFPVKAHSTDAAFDLYAHSLTEDSQYISYGTGIAVNIPVGYVGLLFPRSSITKTSLMFGNAVGVIDSGYLAEISVRVKEIANYEPNIYKVGDRVGQLIVIPIPEIELQEVNEFTSSTERGLKGWGSSGL